VHFDDVLEQMYQKYRSPGGDLREKEAEIVLGDPIYARRVKMPRWNGPVTMLQEPKVAIKYSLSWGIPTSKDAHRQRAEYFQRLLDELKSTYDDLVKYACETYGDYGPLVSGIVHDHFPTRIKDRLRFLSTAKNMVSDAARLHEHLSKTRSLMFR
jgi:hypothetical protein